MKDIHELAMERFAEDTTWMEKTGGYARDMTLRDHFAGVALQECELSQHAAAAQWCYARADAMLKERSK